MTTLKPNKPASAAMQAILAKARLERNSTTTATTATTTPSVETTANEKIQPKQSTQTKASTLQEKIAAIKLEKQRSLEASLRVSGDTDSADRAAKATALTAKLQREAADRRAKAAEHRAKATASAASPVPEPLPRNLHREQAHNTTLLAKLKARVAEAAEAAQVGQTATEIPAVTSLPAPTPTTPAPTATVATGMGGNTITYNAEQQEFIDLARSGKSCVLIGAAGTGKTTCSQGGIQAIIQSGTCPVVSDNLGHKHIPIGAVGVVIVAFTRRAVNNSRRVQPADLKSNCITAHKLLEYAPEYFEVIDPLSGDSRRTMQFLPSRNKDNKLPRTITTVVIEEASMLSEELFVQIVAALPNPRATQFIFIGDIQQLPPVFGAAILGFTLLELPVVELKTVYRQALESPIIRLAHRILSGKAIPASEYPEWKVANKLTLHPWKKKLAPELAATTLAAFFKAAIDNEQYSPYEDMILIPHNKACGTIEVNAHIANHLARKRGVLTYEIVAGFNKAYFSVGDKVLYEKEDAEIVSIESNRAYSGNRPQAPSVTLDYWGFNPNAAKDAESADTYGLDAGVDVDLLLSQMASDSEERVTQASHQVVVRLTDSERDVTLSTSAEINAMLHSYALTVHKSQGSEWRKVFVCLHQSHAAMLQRELLYTAVTRAKEELYCICEPESFTKGITHQRIKGETLAQKAEFFKGKATLRSYTDIINSVGVSD